MVGILISFGFPIFRGYVSFRESIIKSWVFFLFCQKSFRKATPGFVMLELYDVFRSSLAGFLFWENVWPMIRIPLWWTISQIFAGSMYGYICLHLLWKKRPKCRYNHDTDPMTSGESSRFFFSFSLEKILPCMYYTLDIQMPSQPQQVFGSLGILYTYIYISNMMAARRGTVPFFQEWKSA